MSKTYLPYEPDQQLLLPAALQEWLPDDHLAYFISDVVDQLDMSKVTARYERERRGGPPYNPRMMVKVLLYGYCVGVASSRRIAQRLHEDIAFRVLAANNTPDFRTISDFRKDNVDALSGLFVQVLALCHQAGLVKLGHVALDGTKVKANASKHKAMSYQRMQEKAAQLAAEVQSSSGQINMGQFLHDLRRRAQRRPIPIGFDEEVLGGCLEYVRASHRVHEDVCVYEDHVPVTPVPRDSFITRRCSSQSGSVSGPSSTAQDRKNSFTSSGDSNNLTRWRASRRSRAATRNQALSDIPSRRA